MQKVAIVTGSSKGIGKAIALRLAKDNYYVYVTYLSDQKGGEEAVKEIEQNGGKTSLQKVDVRSEQDVTNVMKVIEKEQGHLDLLVNNAEHDIMKTIEESTFEDWKMAIDSKLHGAWLCTKYAIPLLAKSKNANIINISSSADERAPADVLSYATATAALTSLTKNLAVHLTKYGIRVNAVMPSEVRTANWQGLENNDEAWNGFAEKNPMKRVSTVEDVADAVMPLVNDPHKFLNGNLLYVTGGSHLK